MNIEPEVNNITSFNYKIICVILILFITFIVHYSISSVSSPLGPFPSWPLLQSNSSEFWLEYQYETTEIERQPVPVQHRC